jgi:hypothetical protein
MFMMNLIYKFKEDMNAMQGVETAKDFYSEKSIILKLRRLAFLELEACTPNQKWHEYQCEFERLDGKNLLAADSLHNTMNYQQKRVRDGKEVQNRIVFSTDMTKEITSVIRLMRESLRF